MIKGRKKNFYGSPVLNHRLAATCLIIKFEPRDLRRYRQATGYSLFSEAQRSEA
jgi:hypothetical protein